MVNAYAESAMHGDKDPIDSLQEAIMRVAIIEAKAAMGAEKYRLYVKSFFRIGYYAVLQNHRTSLGLDDSSFGIARLIARNAIQRHLRSTQQGANADDNITFAPARPERSVNDHYRSRRVHHQR